MLRALFLLVIVAAGTGVAIAADVPAGRAGAWGVLDKSLNDGNADRRQEALASLATISGPDAQAVKRAEAALKDKVPLIRQSAALTLGEMKAKAAIPALQGMLDDSPEIAFAAAKALAAVGDQSGRDVLLAVLAGERKDEPGMMTSAMRKAKDKLHHPEGLILMGAEDATGAMFGPVSMVIPAIKDAADMKGKGAPGRAAAAAWLARDPDPYAITLLEWALNDENQLVRAEAAKGLGDRGRTTAIAKLEPLLTDSHNLVRDMAAASIIRVLNRGGRAGPVPSSPAAPAAAAKH
jgi:HEAT repeat protein